MTTELKLSDASRDMLRRMPDLAVPALKRGMDEAMILAQGEARLNLSGRVLHRRTGRLRNSIEKDVRISGNRVIGSIGTNVVYGRIHELGFKGRESVQRHARLQTQAFGHSISPRMVEVSAHTREMNMPARSYLRRALTDKFPEIESILARRIEQAFANV